MTSTALVVGGTGPTGPHVLQGLLDRGFDVTIFHRGSHEPEDLPPVRHIHGDPHFRETIAESIGKAEFDVVLAAYGRTRYLAEAFANRTGHFLSIGGTPRYAGFNDPGRTFPSGPGQPLREDAPLATTLDAEGSAAVAFAHQIVRTEQSVFEHQPEATHLIYPMVYGPRNVWPWEWSIVKRVADGRRHVIVADEGLHLHTRGAARNLAEFVLRAVDRPEVARGEVYNCADEVQYSVRQWVELAIAATGGTLEIVSIPSGVAPVFRGSFVPTAATICSHALLDTSKAREQLGYRDVVTPREALEESVAWYRSNPIEDLASFPALMDRFDYAAEDALIAAYRTFATEAAGLGDFTLPAEMHPMPHPKKAGEFGGPQGALT